jgi:hypothetical protein
MPPHIAKVKKLKPLRPKAGMFWLFCVGATSDRRRATQSTPTLAVSTLTKLRRPNAVRLYAAGKIVDSSLEKA